MAELRPDGIPELTRDETMGGGLALAEIGSILRVRLSCSVLT
jgi:hypothetical protein